MLLKTETSKKKKHQKNQEDVQILDLKGYVRVEMLKKERFLEKKNLKKNVFI